MAFIGWRGLEWLIGRIRMHGYGRLDRVVRLIGSDDLDR